MPPKPTRTPDPVAEVLARMRNIILQDNAKGLFSADFAMCLERAIQTHNSRAALQNPAGEWRDISTAPKVGDEILVAHIYEDGSALIDVAGWWVNCWAKRGTEKLCIATKGTVSMIPLDLEPTHWQPLPPAPTGEVG